MKKDARQYQEMSYHLLPHYHLSLLVFFLYLASHLFQYAPQKILVHHEQMRVVILRQTPLD